MFSFYEPFEHREFNQNKWIIEKDRRYEITSDLIFKKLLIGKNKNEIEAFLGKTNFQTPNYLRYYIGYESGFMNIYEDYIEIHFKQGKAYKVVQNY